MKRINIIGAGHVGQTLGTLWNKAGALHIGEVLNTSIDTAQKAVDFMQSGLAVDTIQLMQEADFYLIGCPDTHIESCCSKLAESRLLQPGAIVFHCSGALSSDVLAAAQEQGAKTASLHPVKSFSDPARAITQFDGTYCGLEGDESAVAVLEELVKQINGVPFAIDSSQKAIYHAASVMACNYLVALQEVSLQAFEKAGVERELAMKVLQPLVEGTVSNIFEQGPSQALTGPIARGDDQIVERQLAALGAWRPEMARLYQQLGVETVKLAEQQGKADSEGLEKIEDLFDTFNEFSSGK